MQSHIIFNLLLSLFNVQYILKKLNLRVDVSNHFEYRSNTINWFELYKSYLNTREEG